MAATANDDDELSPFAGRHHARFHDPNVVYHIISRTFQGALLLTPGPDLNDLIAGVLARAQELFPAVRLYAYAFMSNHFLCAAAHNRELAITLPSDAARAARPTPGLHRLSQGRGVTPLGAMYRLAGWHLGEHERASNGGGDL